MDDRLRKGVKGVSDDNDIETTLDKVMILFRYLSEKDMFEKYYKQHLAKRLLSGRAVSLSSDLLMLPCLEQVAKLLYISCVSILASPALLGTSCWLTKGRKPRSYSMAHVP